MTEPQSRDYRETLFLPQTSFAMKAGLPKLEPSLIARWDAMDLYARQRAQSKGKTKFILHDGPPYANGNIHIGHAMNKILKDMIVRSQQMMGKDAPYIPGWDCHGLPIEWEVERSFAKKGRKKADIPQEEFRRECRIYAAEWITTQSKQFQRLGILGDWDHPYTTMSFEAEGGIVAELLKIAQLGLIKQGSKPVMWSPVEQTALAEAEIEYHDKKSTTIWVKFPLIDSDLNASIVIWTTTPWTIPGNRAICFGPHLSYGLYEVGALQEVTDPRTGESLTPWAKIGDRLILADALAEDVKNNAKIAGWTRVQDIPTEFLAMQKCVHPLHETMPGHYDFMVPLLSADHVTDEAGTGFVHTAPGHGAEDYAAVMANLDKFDKDFVIPHTVQEEGKFTSLVGTPLAGLHIIETEGKKTGRDGPANAAVIDLLIKSNTLLARGRIEHSYPHSWRSKAPVIYRNTPQWFISIGETTDPESLRTKALNAIDQTQFLPPSGVNRIRAMVEDRPDWLVSRQRAWGVPITLFVNKATRELLIDEKVNQRIISAVMDEGADAWFASEPSRFLEPDYDPADYDMIDDILDVWFDSGSTHAFVLENREELVSPADIYLEGSDQHRGWFQSSLLESCATRNQAPFKTVFTHGFTVDENGRKMSKSVGNVIDPLKTCNEQGAEILRLWVASANVHDELKVGAETLKTASGMYRKLRNTMRYLCGALADQKPEQSAVEQLPMLEKYILHRFYELQNTIIDQYNKYQMSGAFHASMNFMTNELSSFYFEIRKDCLYCDPLSSPKRKACLFVLDRLFSGLTKLLFPLFPFTMEEAFLARFPNSDDSLALQSVDIMKKESSPLTTAQLQDWQRRLQIRKVVLGALEIERRDKKIGSSLDASPQIYLTHQKDLELFQDIDAPEFFVTSQATLSMVDQIPASSFQHHDIDEIGVVVHKADGKKCARSWRILPEVGSDPSYPDLSLRDAQAVKEWDEIHAG